MAGRLRDACAGFVREHGRAITALVALQFLTYGYFFTTLILTNHTVEHAQIFSYPSYKTKAEGRWMADVIIWLQGGSGVQYFQMVLAAVLQAVNGILFARFAGLDRKFDILLVAALICLYPAFLDGYAYDMDHLTFAVGDLLAIGGVLLVTRYGTTLAAGAATAGLFMLSMACYPPKIGLIALLSLCWLIRRLTEGEQGTSGFRLNEVWRAGGFVAAIVASSGILYLASARLAVTESFEEGIRTELNVPAEMMRQVAASFGVAWESLTDYGMVPDGLWFLPLLCVALGGVAVLRRANRRARTAALVVALLLAVAPITLRAAHIVNSETWDDAGRIVYVNGYALAFLAAYALRGPALRWLAVGTVSLLTYFFVIVGSHESNAAALKAIYERGAIVRLTARVEQAVGDFDGPPRPLVIFGQLPEFGRHRFVRHPSKVSVNFQKDMFATFRQVETLNFFLGRNAFTRPTPGEMEKAVLAVHSRKPWPASEAVFEIDRIVVVLCEKYTPGIARTRTTIE